MEIEIPEGINVTIEDSSVNVSGPKGTVTKALPPVKSKVEDKTVIITAKAKKHLNTAKALIQSAFKGVTEGFEKKMKIVYAHFPITIEVKGKEIHIKNFIGEKTPRIASIVGDTEVKVEKDTITISGPDSYAVGQTAANMKTATKIKKKDPRKFQDGIYDLVE